MVMFVIEERHLQQLSPSTRRELLQVLGSEVEEARQRYAAMEWQPDGAQSYPLTEEEARHLLHGMPESARNLLGAFAERYDGKRGAATFRELLKATGHTKVESLGRQIAWIELRLRTVTGNHDAWLITWRKSDWKWSEQRQTYIRGRYFINGPAVIALRAAMGLD